MAHSTPEKTAPIKAKFFAYPKVVTFISLNTCLAVWGSAVSVTEAGPILAENRPIAAPRTYPEKLSG